MKPLYLIIGAVIIVAGTVALFVVQAPSEEAADVPLQQEMPTMGNIDDVVEIKVQEEDLPTEESVAMEMQGEHKTFTVSGTNFAFDIAEMRVAEGDTVTINFSSAEGFHDWAVDAFGAATEKVKPNTPTSVTFIADKVGTYEYYCSVGSHRANGMVGTLIVE